MATNTKRFKKTIIMHKSYFDKGIALLSYGKYIIASLGLASRNINTILLISTAYAMICYFTGLLWIKSGLLEQENNFYNDYNPFVRKMLSKRFK